MSMANADLRVVEKSSIPLPTPGPWQMWTSCSFRRISSAATGKDGDVLHAVTQRSDGHPDLHFPNGGFNGPDARLILAAPDLLEAAQLANRILFLLTPEVERLGLRAENVPAKLRAAIAKATGEPA